MVDQDKHYQPGERVGPYEILDPKGFAGTLPTAVIVSGSNKGVKVILTRATRAS